jgi:hypothetical protein
MMQHPTRPLIILGSSNSDGHTKKSIERVFPARNNVFVDLATLDISHYDYNNFNRYDAFIPLAEKMLQHQN